MSSKFSSPFFKKSPLQGAYSSGAGGMVTVSYDNVHQKFQDGIASNVAKAYAPKTNSCSNLEKKLADGTIKEGAYIILSAKCAEQNNKNEDLENNIIQPLDNLLKPGTVEFDINSMQADDSNKNERGTIS
jgi:hypothetical protein